MRLTRQLLALAVLAASLTPPLSPLAAAQQPPSGSACNGTINLIRVNEIKPGMMDEFLIAVAKQQAWYKNAGAPDLIQVMSVMIRNPATRAFVISDKEAITTHIEPAIRTEPAHDAAYNTFVSMYNESSTVKSTFVTCVVQ
ncbi:MAG: hypothetical protein ABR910_00340 [Acidobacteriaceae bacterium]|jgi:hypothetical protein